MPTPPPPPSPPNKTHSKSHDHREPNRAEEDGAHAAQQQDGSEPQPLHACRLLPKKHRYYERFSASSFADNQVEGDITAGEDPIVRAAAVEALGNMNGTVVAIDPDSGRILAMVNQKLALSAGAQPCSTIKVAVALAALSENVITKDTQVPLGKYWRVDLTTALAHSNNAYFEAVGRKLGFEGSAITRSSLGWASSPAGTLTASIWGPSRRPNSMPSSAA